MTKNMVAVLVLLFLPTNILFAQDDVAKELIQTLKGQVTELKEANKILTAENAKLKEEIEQLRKGVEGKESVAKPRAEKDAFVNGTVLAGTRIMVPDWKQNLTLVVTKRDGTNFEGELTYTNVVGGTNKDNTDTNTLKVSGRAPVGDGNVNFVTEKQGKYQHSFRGKFSNGALGFDCGGTSPMGAAVQGKGVLRVK